MTNSPFHDPQGNPLPDANDIEKEANSIELYSLQKKDIPSSGPSAHTKQDIKWLRNAVIWLLVIGSTLGLVLGIIAAIFLKRAGLVDPPKPTVPQSALPHTSSQTS